MHPESYYINKINKLKERIKELDKQQEDYEAERNSILNTIDELQYYLSQSQAEEWINEAKQGLHKKVMYNEVPQYVKNDLFAIINSYTQNCTGNEDECRKCGQMCVAKGYEEFKKKYNIETIQY